MCTRRIILATHMGFCFGVRRAVDMVERARQTLSGPVTTLGPIIHSQQVVEHHKSIGIGLCHELAVVQEGTVVLSAHGVSPVVEQQAVTQGLHVINATCPYVAKLHKAAVQQVKLGYSIVLLGDAGHSEVKGTVGAIEHAGGMVNVLSDSDEASNLPFTKHIALLSQTTQKLSTLAQVAAALVPNCQELHVINTICHATDELQSSARIMAQQVEVAIVIGGKNSANTKRLRDICEAEGVPAYHIETSSELSPDWFYDKTRIGITAGASTPDWLIHDVTEAVQQMTGAEVACE